MTHTRQAGELAGESVAVLEVVLPDVLEESVVLVALDGLEKEPQAEDGFEIGICWRCLAAMLLCSTTAGERSLDVQGKPVEDETTEQQPAERQRKHLDRSNIYIYIY